MAHPLVDQLRFTRSEFVRALEGVTDEEARRRFEPMNCISWIVGHLAVQENYYWVFMGQGKSVIGDLYKRVGYGSPPSTPPLDEMWTAWRAVTTAADAYLETLTAPMLATHLADERKTYPESIGTMLLRNTYHYWYHLGEASAIRQMLGHSGLPEFVGNMAAASYRAPDGAPDGAAQD